MPDPGGFLFPHFVKQPKLIAPLIFLVLCFVFCYGVGIKRSRGDKDTNDTSGSKKKKQQETQASMPFAGVGTRPGGKGGRCDCCGGQRPGGPGGSIVLVEQDNNTPEGKQILYLYVYVCVVCLASLCDVAFFISYHMGESGCADVRRNA